MRPRSGAIRPAIILTSVVLPAPDGPNSPATPSGISSWALMKKSPSRFSTSMASISLSVKVRAGAPRQPFGDHKGSERDENCDQYQASCRFVSARRLREGVDRSRDGLRLARDIRHECNGGAELSQRLGKAQHDAG